MRQILFFLSCILIAQGVFAQRIRICGTVYDATRRNPIEAVAVIAKSGHGTLTDSLGRYCITVPTNDSIWFSLIGKTTKHYAVDTIQNPDNFDVMVMIKATELPEVKVRNNYYKFDSMQNRKDYAKYFDFKKPGLRLSSNNNTMMPGVAAGFDLEELINVFRFNRTRRLLALQKRLLEQEQEKYINHRYNKNFVRKLTKLSSPELDTFMNRYRPDYEFVTTLNDLELGYYIQKCFEKYKASKRRRYGNFRRPDEDLH